MSQDHKKLAKQVMELAESVRSRKIDPLDVKLQETYRELQEIIADVDGRITVDELLNEVLSSKVTRIQDLAKVLGAPELYITRLSELKPMEIAKLIVYKNPVVVTTLPFDAMERADDRIQQMIDKTSREPEPDDIPEMTGVPEDYLFTSQDSVFLADLKKYLKSIPKKAISIDELLETEDFDEFLKRFLYIVILVSRGDLVFDKETQTVWRS
ncbi:MAG: hypothetical protein BAJATHORv1_30327 [Candidatus Thorarchaeota archaeon]|nr:MAG: hypothetical protein BAJATHORv1_30327 [Candidatus Thorarchaeota archaeon]